MAATSSSVSQGGKMVQTKSSRELAWHSLVTDTYGMLWKMIIRPPRSRYEIQDLGPRKFRIKDSIAFERRDYQLINDRGHTLECSHFLPWDERIDTGELKVPVVVYLHGNCSSRLEAGDALQVLLPRGVSVLSFDMSGSGKSGGTYISLGHYEEQDLKVIIAHLRMQPYVTNIGLWGRSMGAATSVLRAAEDWSLSALVVDSAFSNLPVVASELVNCSGIPVPDFVTQMAIQSVREEILTRAKFDINELLPIRRAPYARSPVLFAVASDDTFILPHHTDDLLRAWGGPEKRIRTFEGGHNGSRPATFLQEAADWLRDHLLTGPKSATMTKPMAEAEANRWHEDVEDVVVACPPPPEPSRPTTAEREDRRSGYGGAGSASDTASIRRKKSSSRKASASSSRRRPTQAESEGMFLQLTEMGYTGDVAEEASLECCAVNEALDYITEQSTLAMRESISGLRDIEMRAASSASGGMMEMATALKGFEHEDASPTVVVRPSAISTAGGGYAEAVDAAAWAQRATSLRSKNGTTSTTASPASASALVEQLTMLGYRRDHAEQAAERVSTVDDAIVFLETIHEV